MLKREVKEIVECCVLGLLEVYNHCFKVIYLTKIFSSVADCSLDTSLHMVNFYATHSLFIFPNAVWSPLPEAELFILENETVKKFVPLTFVSVTWCGGVYVIFLYFFAKPLVLLQNKLLF
uniref:Uncharacterized protein n=1 Tax=Oryzias latipes TaxID=8090 RepID=A0A3P9L7V0_ORYLA